MSSKKKTAPTPPQETPATAASTPAELTPAATPPEEAGASDEKPKAVAKPKAAERKLAVAKEVLEGIFADDPKGVYYSKDGETFLNEEQYDKLADKGGYEKFEK